MSTKPQTDIIKAILTNATLTEDEKSNLISKLMDEFKAAYPDLQYHATKQDVSETELKLIKEIESIKLEIRDVDAKLKK